MPHHQKQATAVEQTKGRIRHAVEDDAASLLYQADDISPSLDEVSDESLLHALAGGAVWAMEPLYQRYRRLLYSVAYRMVADHHVVENLLQEVFFTVWRRATSYSPHLGTVRTWLIAIMHHRTVDYVRSGGCHATVKEVTWEVVEQERRPVSPDVWEEAWLAIQSARVQTALMHIPKEQQLVIELAYFQGWTHREIAEAYQVPLGTVKGRIRLGLLHLKRALEQREEQER
jgi:RNA polymerase sigma-70 factor (ECF subfamily)